MSFDSECSINEGKIEMSFVRLLPSTLFRNCPSSSFQSESLDIEDVTLFSAIYLLVYLFILNFFPSTFCYSFSFPFFFLLPFDFSIYLLGIIYFHSAFYFVVFILQQLNVNKARRSPGQLDEDTNLSRN